MKQNLDFYTGNKSYRLRNGTLVKITAREIIHDRPRYYGEELATKLAHVWFANGSCASGYDFDLAEGLTGVRWEKE